MKRDHHFWPLCRSRRPRNIRLLFKCCLLLSMGSCMAPSPDIISASSRKPSCSKYSSASPKSASESDERMKRQETSASVGRLIANPPRLAPGVFVNNCLFCGFLQHNHLMSCPHMWERKHITKNLVVVRGGSGLENRNGIFMHFSEGKMIYDAN